MSRSNNTQAWRLDKDGVRLFIALIPKSSRDSIEGIVDTVSGKAFKARVRAIPDKGKANQALIKLVSKWVGVPKTSIELISGSRSKLKTVKIYGDSSEISKQLAIRVKLGSNSQ